jgi:hypothetical protein
MNRCSPSLSLCVRALACVFLVHALLSGVTAWAGPCYGLDPCDHNCPDHCTRAECGPPDPCDRSCPATYDPTAEHVKIFLGSDLE